MGVTFAQASQFCHRMGKELPTEEQWETAARGRQGRLFPWGDDPARAREMLKDEAAVKQQWGAGTKKRWEVAWEMNRVASWDRSPVSVEGMAGGVAEWTRSEFKRYEARLVSDPGAAGAPSGDPDAAAAGSAIVLRVIRGGSGRGGDRPEDDDVSRYRTTRRLARSESYADDTVGFRCVRDLGK